MPILADEDEIAAFRPPESLCAMCEHKLKTSCVREVRVELCLSQEGGGGYAPDILLSEPDTARSLLFCSPACAREAARTVASEVQNPTKDDDGRYFFPGHLPFRGKVEKWDIHFTKIGPASYDDGQSTASRV